MSLRQVCHCQHDKDTHHDKRHNCLAVHCDCREYVNENDPLPKRRQTFPAARPVDEEDFDSCPITWPMFPINNPPCD